ncbi:IS66 family insertion sequence element accessory protein TnpA [Shewanella frigidimarina]|uniref:IS66 family insertion sequence element accessory protein TnpA n=1 Tax=Shewanella frigidimarina TaxID=56812 RepID=UPI003CCC7437
MAKRSHDDCLVLIKQQRASALTIYAFCRQHKLSNSSLYTHRTDMVKIKSFTPFY